MTNLYGCQLLVSLGLQLQELSGKPADYACIAEGLSTIEPLYSRAAKGKGGASSERLKDFYASWRAALNGVRPSYGEIVIAYKTRQSKTFAALDEKAERIKLD